MVNCPICGQPVKQIHINAHLDASCRSFIDIPSPDASANPPQVTTPNAQKNSNGFGGFFARPSESQVRPGLRQLDAPFPSTQPTPSRLPKHDFQAPTDFPPSTANPLKRPHSPQPSNGRQETETELENTSPRTAKRPKNDHAPLADRMRPRTLDEITGQPLLAEHGLLRIMLESNRIPSMVLWGGPGTGKTTIARLIAAHARPAARFVEFNATATSIVDLKKIFQEAAGELQLTKRRTIVFCDEIHRFSKSQQDVFLRPVEDGTIILVGATTENPSFKVIGALLSRCRVLTLEPLKDDDIEGILRRATDIECAHLDLSTPPSLINEQLISYLSRISAGDARTALNLLELTLSLSASNPSLQFSDLKTHLRATLSHDRAGDAHYTLISAFHKSVRGSSADGALYYLARMIEGGEDPLFVARRMVVIASEDVGLASETMLPLATACYTACEKIGMPECRINLAHCAVALALAPKSVRSYRGYNAAIAAVKEEGGGAGGRAGAGRGTEVPWHLRNATTRLLREMGAGKEYKYNPDFKDGKVVQEYLPEGLRERRFLGDEDLGDEVDPELVERDEAGVADDVGGEKEEDQVMEGAKEEPSLPTQNGLPSREAAPPDNPSTPKHRMEDKGIQSSPPVEKGLSDQHEVAEEPPIEIDDWEK